MSVDIRDGVFRKCAGDHWCKYVESLVVSTPITLVSGFVYAGETKNGLIKVGKSIQQCPLCRMDQNKLEYLGLVWVEKASVFEQIVISKMGTPVVGSEWFDDKKLIADMISGGWMHDVARLNTKLAVMFG